MSDPGERVLALAEGWIGTPYRHQASLKDVGCDCLGLIRGIWRDLYGHEPELPPPYAPDWAERGGEDRLMAAAKRHFPAVAGLYQSPTVLNNVETFCAVPPIILNGGQWFADLGTPRNGGTRLFSISFHSPSVEPGHTPYVRDAGDLKRFYAWFDGVFGFLAKAGVEPASIEEVLAAAEAAR